MRNNHQIRVILFSLTALIMVACGSDDYNFTTGNILVSPDSSPATAQNPAKSSAGHPATVTISQKARYDDPDGSTYNCEPQATVTLTTGAQVVKVKNLKELTTMTQTSTQTKKGQNPVIHETVQTFELGGQKLTFTLSYEVYTYTNSENRQVEMPYINLSAAKNGEVVTGTRSADGGRIAVTGMRLIPKGTRSRDGGMETYDVHVSFTVDATTANTSDGQSRTLSFEADFTGVVDNTQDSPGWQMAFNYTLDTHGTTDIASPFTLSSGSRQMSIAWNQVVQHTLFSSEELATKVTTFEPRAQVLLTMETDSAWAESREAIEKVTAAEPVVSVTGDDPTVTTGKQVFNIGGQKITLDYSYDAYGDVNIDGNSVAMPYLELSTPEIKSVNVTKLQTTKISGKDAVVYEVTARIAQQLKSVNLAEPVTENVEYIVKYIGIETVRLVKVTYRKDWEWLDCNPGIGCFAQVYRERTYSTGETYTDKFEDYGHLVDYGIVIGFNPAYEEFTGSEQVDGVVGDSVCWAKRTIGVPDISKVEAGFYTEPHFETPPIGSWNEYRFGLDYTEYHTDVSLDNVEVVGSNGTSSQASGWYFYTPQHQGAYGFLYDNSCDNFSFIGIYPMFYDQYLVIDGQMITFLEFHEPFKFSYTEEYTTMEDGSPAKVCTFKGENRVYEKKFYGIGQIIFYQK